MAQQLLQLKLIKTSTHWARKHIPERTTDQKPSISIFMFLPHVPLTQDLRARLHAIHIQHLGAPSPFSRDMSCGKAGIINVTRGSIWTATWRDQRLFPQTAKTIFTHWPTVWSESMPRSIYQSQRISQFGSTGLRGDAGKSLARPGRKQATATKFGIYSTYTPRSSMQFLARCSNFCKPLKKKLEGCPSNQVSAAAMPSASDEKRRHCFGSSRTKRNIGGKITTFKLGHPVFDGGIRWCMFP